MPSLSLSNSWSSSFADFCAGDRINELAFQADDQESGRQKDLERARHGGLNRCSGRSIGFEILVSPSRSPRLCTFKASVRRLYLKSNL